ncbi:hypothetical protein ABH17_029370 (plasmid) [Bacillus toyonensis]|uniref:ATP-binding protein n=1 Tax=Bacillus toyonensis TaxID=155322 RepID=UPI0006AA51A6|nr:ATP-binding protein [Bacillus toyonensis]OKO50510.1 hypothetical protein ABH17_029370 [Bacillus toyonensis]
MAFEVGGRADKLGNRHEGWWVAKQLLRLLKEEIVSVTIEAIGEDERGVDLWIEHKDGIRQAQQCKARNASKEGWSVSDLKTRGILDNLKYQLDRDSIHEFALVSAVTCTLLNDLCESARNSNGNAEDYYKYQILTRGKESREAYKIFCSAVSLDYKIEKDRERTFEYLYRTKMIQYSDDEETKQSLQSEIGILLTGEPKIILTNLIGYAENNDKFGRPIYANDLYAFFRENGIYPKNLAQDIRVLPAIEKLQREFTQSIQPLLVQGELISRPETQQCIETLERDGLVIISGDSGVGKSGVLYEITHYLRDERIPYLPLRIDRRVPQNTAKHYGLEMGLPDSPVYCLTAIAGDRPAILIIDQLDAIRWTSAHSSNALDVCKELINQVLAYRRYNKDIRVILSCRSFDLNYDLELKSWLQERGHNGEGSWEKIEVSLLPEDSVRNLVGNAYDQATQKQKELLRHPQSLFMWFALHNRETTPTLKSSVDLMRQFWGYKIEAIEKQGITQLEIKNVLNTLIERIERSGRISVPINRIITQISRSAISSLQSNGILKEENGTVSFSHQSYIDFLIAEKVVRDIESGESILNWLGSREKQTLFRREQLRQALNILWEDNPFGFLDVIQEVLYNENVRFHLKHLILEVIGHLPDVNWEIENFVLQLLNNNYWKSHILDTILLGNNRFTKILIEQGTIQKWLDSDNDEDVQKALGLLREIKEKLPKEVARILTPYVYQDKEWKNNLLQTIGWDIEVDSDEIFELRLLLARNNIFMNYMNWTRICSIYPTRSIRVIEVILSMYETTGKIIDNKLDSYLGHWYDADLRALVSVAEKNCVEVWDSLMPHIERIIKESNENNIGLEWEREFKEYRLITGTIELLIAAGKKMASDFPEILIQKVNNITNPSSNIIRRIIGESYSCLHTQYSDVGIEWLLLDYNHLILGDKTRDKYVLTRKIIGDLSPYCSAINLRKLEQYLIYYHEPDEVEYARRCLVERKDGWYYHYWGKAQYLLLTSLCKERISKEVYELIRVLKRRYNGRSVEDLLEEYKTKSGFVGSTLDKNVLKISDKSWLKIITNTKVPQDFYGSSKRRSRDTFLETSVWQFSRSLETAAKHNPERFGKLALHFSDVVNPNYIAAILRAFEETDFSSQVNDGSTWKPALLETMNAFLRKINNFDNKEVALSFCNLISKRSDEEWSMDIINKLMSIATKHTDPEQGVLNVYESKRGNSVNGASVNDLFTNSINCVRGVAVEALGKILWTRPELFEVMESTIEELVNDNHPSVRMSTVYLLLPVISINKDKAVEWFVKTVKDDLRIACCEYSVSFINYTIKPYSDLIGPIIANMLLSDNNEIAKMGSRMVTGYYVFHDLFKRELQVCYQGTTCQRQGVVLEATRLISKREYSFKCIAILEPFLETYDANVAKEMSELFRHEIADLKEHVSLVKKYISSGYLEDHILMMYKFKEHKGSFLDYSEIILHYCEVLCENYAEKTKDNKSELSYSATQVSELLLRLYEQSMANNRQVFNQCLDMWDKLFEGRIGPIKKLSRVVEQV